MAEEIKYVPKEYFWRNRVILPIALKLIGVPMTKSKDVHCDRYRPKHKTFLLIANHNETLDPVYEMVCLGRYVRYVSSDHVVRGVSGRLLHFFGTLIIKYRDRPREELTKNILDTLHAGISVGVHAEGGMSFNGESRYILPNTAKLAKDADCAVITFRSYGGYLRTPRWRKHRRKGPLYGGVVREYSKEEIRSMTQEEVYEMLCRDLYVNAYEEQRKNPHDYTGENLAESCEIVLYQCPACKQVGTLKSSHNHLSCACGYRLEMKPDGFFHSCGQEVIFDNICDWDHWQREAIRSYLDGFSGKSSDPALRDTDQTLVKIVDEKEVPLSERATVELYYDRIEIHWESGDWSAPLTSVQRMDFVKHSSLLVVTETDYFDISASVPRSATKYIDAWRYLTGKPNY